MAPGAGPGGAGNPARALPLSPLELAAGVALPGQGELDPLPGQRPGQADPDPAPPPSAPRGRADARAQLEREVLAGLLRPPCLVSFSGGRDSSAVLAVATAVARREGLPDPVPVTERFPGVASAEESAWQEMVVRELRLGSWQRLAFGDELGLLGPVARDALTSHGLLWPPNAYLHVPMLDLAAGGSLLTGLDGDGLFGGWRWLRVQSVLHCRAAPRPRDALRIGLAVGPAAWRRRRFAGAAARWFPWLRQPGAAAVDALLAAEAAAEPRRWDRRAPWFSGRRHLRLAVHSLALLAGARDVTIIHPLLGRPFVAALAAQGGAAGLGDRTAIMRLIVGDLLPEAILARPTKAEFGAAIWRGRARAFAESWNLAGADPRLVDAAGLRAAWLSGRPPFPSATLLHAAWLAARQDSAPGGGVNYVT